MRFAKIHYPYTAWEEYPAGLWRHVHSAEDRERLLRQAIKFTGDAKLYGSYMMKVLDVWPISCIHNLTTPGLNRQAWIGHAACCLALNCPEDITRLAWHYLSQNQQDEANAMADAAIAAWEEMYKAKALQHNEAQLRLL